MLTIANNSAISVATPRVGQPFIYYVILTILSNDDFSTNRYQHLHMKFLRSRSGIARTKIRRHAPIA
ncbi:protein of unknown function [Paraburkholderia dioscoreae]|uniref:Uncharacterized protein n=1 Tax=Paraburkholderia dioscoreae TaxID=2604047 RepID=A0A5Q4ZK01_9BURK|nr:protein of unknown function [Paraburkholderia dioscoreae]